MIKVLKWLTVLTALVVIQRPVIGQESQGATVNREEAASLASTAKDGPGTRLVITGVQLATKDRFNRPAQKATVKKESDGTLLIIGAFWKEDGELLMPGGRMFAAREGGTVVVAAGGLLNYDGSARIMEPDAKLADFLPTAPGSVIRFIGPVGFEGSTFDGSERDPLSFGLVERVGFVYLRGSGSVKLPNGQIRQLGAR